MHPAQKLAKINACKAGIRESIDRAKRWRGFADKPAMQSSARTMRSLHGSMAYALNDAMRWHKQLSELQNK